MSEIMSEAKMSSVAVDREEMQALLRLAAGPEGSEAEKIARVARSLKLGFRRAKGLWYGDARRIETHESEAARAAARRREEASTNAEITQLMARLARLEARLAVVDPEFFSPARDAMREQVGTTSRMADGG